MFNSPQTFIKSIPYSNKERGEHEKNPRLAIRPWQYG